MTTGAGTAGAGLRVASFNVHCGVDGWGRPFDVVAACRAVDADVLVLQESWRPDDGAASTAGCVAAALGYHVVEEVLARGRLLRPDPSADARWGPGIRRTVGSLRLDGGLPGRRTAARYRPSEAGSWGLAVLTRVPVDDVDTVGLGRLGRDRARRLAIRCRLAVDDRTLTVLGTHMSHLEQGSPTQFRRLRSALPGPGEPGVVTGDMNLWGPAVVALLPGWRRAVTGRTWPASRPHSQLDHLLVNRSAAGRDGAVLPLPGSDHLPVRATVTPA